MATARPDRRLVAASRLVENLAHRLPETRHHIATELAALDGWATRGDTVTVSVMAEMTTVELHADQRLALTTALADLEAHATAIATIAANALEDCNRLLGRRTTTPVPRCDGRGFDGYTEWGDPTCHRTVDKADMCSACYQRCRRWRQMKGLRALHQEPLVIPAIPDPGIAVTQDR